MPFLALLSLAKRFWPYLAGAIAIAAVWAAVLHYGAKREAEGRAEVQSAWDAQKLKDAAAVAALNAKWQEASAAATAAKAERDRAYEIASRPITAEVKAYVQSPAARAACLDARGLQAATAAVKAANTATAAR